MGLPIQFQFRGDTRDNWVSAGNPVLKEYEIGIIKETNGKRDLVVGDNETPILDLPSSVGGVPIGGLAGQVLKKLSDTDLDTVWADIEDTTIYVDTSLNIVTSRKIDKKLITTDTEPNYKYYFGDSGLINIPKYVKSFKLKTKYKITEESEEFVEKTINFNTELNQDGGFDIFKGTATNEDLPVFVETDDNVPQFFIINNGNLDLDNPIVFVADENNYGIGFISNVFLYDFIVEEVVYDFFPPIEESFSEEEKEKLGNLQENHLTTAKRQTAVEIDQSLDILPAGDINFILHQEEGNKQERWNLPDYVKTFKLKVKYKINDEPYIKEEWELSNKKIQTPIVGGEINSEGGLLKDDWLDFPEEQLENGMIFIINTEGDYKDNFYLYIKEGFDNDDSFKLIESWDVPDHIGFFEMLSSSDIIATDDGEPQFISGNNLIINLDFEDPITIFKSNSFCIGLVSLASLNVTEFIIEELIYDEVISGSFLSQPKTYLDKNLDVIGSINIRESGFIMELEGEEEGEIDSIAIISKNKRLQIPKYVKEIYMNCVYNFTGEGKIEKIVKLSSTIINFNPFVFDEENPENLEYLDFNMLIASVELEDIVVELYSGVFIDLEEEVPTIPNINSFFILAEGETKNIESFEVRDISFEIIPEPIEDYNKLINKPIVPQIQAKTITVPTSGYTDDKRTVTLEGITEESNLLISLKIDSKTDVEVLREERAKIYKIKPIQGGLEIYVTETPIVEFELNIIIME